MHIIFMPLLYYINLKFVIGIIGLSAFCMHSIYIYISNSIVIELIDIFWNFYIFCYKQVPKKIAEPCFVVVGCI